MAMKVHELAKEMNLNSKDIIERAEKLGISVKSHMSVLSDSDIEKIKEGRKPAAPAASGHMGAGVRPQAPAGRPGRRPPIGRPIVDNDYLENKHKKHDEKKAEPKAEAAPEKETEKKASAPEAAPKETPKAAAPEVPAPKAAAGEKAAPKKETAAKKTPEKESVTPSIPGRQTLKIITKAEDVRAAEAARKARAEEKAAERAAERKNEKSSEKGQGRRADGRGKGPRRGDRPERPGRDGKNEGGRGDGRKGERPDRAKGGRDDHGNRRGPAPRREQPAASGRDDGRGDHAGRSDRKKHDKHEKDKGRNKFEKFEKKSLEKQTRKKHVKAKPAQTEPEIEAEPLPEGTIVLNVPITVAGFCEQTEVSTSKVIMTLMKLGIMANINQTIDEDTVMILAEELGLTVAIGNVEEEEVEEGLELFEDREQDLKPRPPIITVMGHVDHGKTSLLDAIRKTNVTASESGGITQHIGASEVRINGQKIVFLDTPGHEAFTAMRARGAHVTDIAVLVVAADDGVMPQTVESISHAKAAGVPIIVAINKMDKPGANPDRVKQELAEHGVLVEDWGGDVISVPVSAKTGDGIVNLLEMILLQAEMMELRANPDRLAMGSVIEARLDKSKGPVATLLVTNGTLHSGQSIVAGTCAGRIRLMTDYKGKTIKKAGPATAVEVLGLTDVPQAGDEFNAVKEDKIAREIAEHRKEKLREEVLARNASTTLEQLFSQIQEGEVKELNLIIKGDVQGSVGALVSSLEKLNNESVKVNIIHTGVGTVTESDVMLAGTSGSVIIGFNVRPSTAVQTMADRENIQIRTYRVIYDVIDDVENAMKGMLDPEFKEEILGKAEIRNTFKVPGVGIVGGAYVTEGKIVRNADVRLVRDGIVIHEGKISSLKRFKDDAKEVASGYECGIGIENYNDIKEGDVIECFHIVEIERK